jgi:aspartyl/asparaginyl-tRNA synthetase
MDFQVPNFSTIRFIDRMMQAGEQHLRSRGFFRVTVPRIVPASGACENVDTLFEVAVDGEPHWFHGNKRAYFAQTGQLYLEALLAEGGLPKLYCVGPSARAESVVDTRHLTEFEMTELEFRGTFDELLVEIEMFLRALGQSMREVSVDERGTMGISEDLSYLDMLDKSFPRIRYADAIAELGLPWGSDISSSLEKKLIANHSNGPILVVRYPNPMSEKMQLLFNHGVKGLAIKFFNMIPDPEDPDYVLSADCIVPFGGECVGSASRVHTYQEFHNRLVNSLMFKRLLEKDPNALQGFSWYLGMLENFPSFPHTGCGFGMSRIFQFLLQKTDITQVVTFASNRALLH